MAHLNELQRLTSIFKLLSDKTRLHILLLLADGERNVTELCKLMGLPQPTVSHHLALLRMSSVIGQRRSGKQVYYALNGEFDQTEGAGLKLVVDDFAVAVVNKTGGRGVDGHTRIVDGTDGHDGVGRRHAVADGVSERPVSAR